MEAFLESKLARDLKKRVRAPRGGVVLKTVHALNDIPQHFHRGQGSTKRRPRIKELALSKFLKDKDLATARCYGVYFGRSKDEPLQRKYFQFAVFAVDHHGVHHGLLSRRPLSEGNRHTFLVCSK